MPVAWKSAYGHYVLLQRNPEHGRMEAQVRGISSVPNRLLAEALSQCFGIFQLCGHNFIGRVARDGLLNHLRPIRLSPDTEPAALCRRMCDEC